MSYIQQFIESTTAPVLLRTAITAIITLIGANIVLNVVKKILEKTNAISKAFIGFVFPVVKFIVYFFVFIFIANALGFNTSSIVALASVLSAAVALAAQNGLSNLFGGVTLLLTHPFDVNDYISVAGFDGVVHSIGVFYTILKTLDNKTITIPNGTVSSSTIINYSTEGKRRVDLVISTSYDCKVDDVKASITKAIERTENADSKDAFVRLSNYGSSAIEYTVRVWTTGANYWQVYFDLLENVKRCFDEDGIIMTYDHIIVHNAKD